MLKALMVYLVRFDISFNVPLVEKDEKRCFTLQLQLAS